MSQAKVIGRVLGDPDVGDGKFIPARGFEGTQLHVVRPIEIAATDEPSEEDDSAIGSILHELRSRARRLERDAARAEEELPIAAAAVDAAQDRFAKRESPEHLEALRAANDAHLRAVARARGLARAAAQLRATLAEKKDQIAADDELLRKAWLMSAQPDVAHREQLDRVHALGVEFGRIGGALYRYCTDASEVISGARAAAEHHGLPRTFAPSMTDITAYQVALSRAFAQGLLDSGVQDLRPLVTKSWLLKHLPSDGEKTWADQGLQARFPSDDDE
jgi:hypothetical protein